MSNPVGAPRTVCPPPEEMIALGKEMVSWFKNHPEALHISYWHLGEKFIVHDVWQQMIIKPEFCGYYELAQQLVSKNYIDKNSNVREGVSQRWQRVYFKDLKKEEDETYKWRSEIDAKAKSELAEVVSPETVAMYEGLVRMFLKDQSPVVPVVQVESAQ